jgi:SNF2 family DNA or RNA helicase
MGGYKGKQVVEFKNTPELARSIKTASFRVTKEECLDLPPKLYARRDVGMAGDQKREYERMRNEFLAMIDKPCPDCDGTGYVPTPADLVVIDPGAGHDYRIGEYVTECPTCQGTACSVSVTIALTQMLRLQQITSGFITDGPEVLHWFTEKPPKIMEVMDIIEDGGDQSFIHWSNFRPEIARLCQELAFRGLNYVEIHGGINEHTRVSARMEFQAAEVKHLVANQAAGGIGLDLWRASIANYLSNSFKTEDRIQSEDRCHRIGSEVHDSVNFNDIVVPGTVDVHILRVIRNNRNLSDAIMSGGLKELIT